MEKKLIRLTESDLHNIIKESVEKILQEGQGWDTFKHMNSASFDDINNTYKDGKRFRDDVKKIFDDESVQNFVKHGGDNSDKHFRYYNPYDPIGGTQVYHDGYKEIDNSAMGKIGRAAGTAAGLGSMAAKRGLGKMGNAMKKGASAVGEKASEMARNAKSQMMKNRINRQAKKSQNNTNGEYDSFTM